MSPIVKSTELFALEVLNDPKYDEFDQYIDKEEIQKAFDEYGYKLNPFNGDSYSVGMIPPNVEGHFLSQNIPEVEALIINEAYNETLLQKILDKNPEITHICLSTYAEGLKHSVDAIRIIQRDFPEKTLYIGGMGTKYFHLQELLKNDKICFGNGVNWLREKFGLRKLQPKEFKIPQIKSQSDFFMESHYTLTQVGCMFNCDFCGTNKLLSYIPFSDEKKIITYLDSLRNSSKNDLFLYVCDPNGLYPEKTWMNVFKYFIETQSQRDNHIYMIVLASLSHLKKFNLKQIQEECALKFFMVNFGMESTLVEYKKNLGINKDFIQYMNKIGIITYHNFILGLPHHTEKSISLEIERNLEYKSAMYSINTMKPIPTTGIYETISKEGRLFGKDLPVELYYRDGFLPFKHKHLGKGFSILRYAFESYCKCEESIIDMGSSIGNILANNPLIQSSKTIKNLTKMLIGLSKVNLPILEMRIPELVPLYHQRIAAYSKKIRKR